MKKKTAILLLYIFAVVILVVGIVLVLLGFEPAVFLAIAGSSLYMYVVGYEAYVYEHKFAITKKKELVEQIDRLEKMLTDEEFNKKKDDVR